MQYGNSNIRTPIYYTLFLGFLFTFQLGIAQNLEEKIYKAVDTFNSNTSVETFHKLIEKETEFGKKLNTKNEYLAFIHLLCNKGYYLKTKIPGDAITTYELAWKLFNDQKLPLSHYDMIENCLKPLGNLYTKTKNYTNAENIILLYISLAKENSNFKHEIAGIINLSKLYQSINKHQDVIHLIKSYRKNTAIPKEQLQKLKSIEHYSFISLEKNHQNVVTKHEVMSSDEDPFLKYTKALKSKNYKNALQFFNRYKSNFFASNYSRRDLMKFYIQEAQLYFLSEHINDNTSESKKILQEALNILLPSNKLSKENLYAETLFIDIFDLLAQLQQHEKDALYYIDLSIYVASLLEENLVDKESKFINLNDIRKQSEMGISLAYDAFQKTQDTSFVIKALKYAENSKAFLLKKKKNLNSLLEEYPTDTLLLKHQQLTELQTKLIHEILSARSTIVNSKIFLQKQQQLASINFLLKNNSLEIKRQYDFKTDELSVIKIQKKLQVSSAALVEYFYGEYAIYQFIISKDEVVFYKLPLMKKHQRILSKFINYFDKSNLINNDIEDFKVTSFKLYNFLNFKLLEDYTDLIIIPDGRLSFISFESLLTSETSSRSYQEMPFLLFKHHISYDNSAMFYQNNSTATIDFKVLGVFPIFKNSNRELRYTEKEASKIKDINDGLFLLHEEATKQAFIENAKSHNILHLSTHASSGDFFIPASIEFIDSTLHTVDLENIKFNPDLVILSACETGVGVLRKGEGAMSISRGFQSAGANNVLFSLWKVNDLATTTLMANFYKYLEKHNVVEANRHSKISYLKSEVIPNAKKSPYYWASFVYYGERELYKHKNTKYSYYYLAGIGILLLIVVVYKKSQP